MVQSAVDFIINSSLRVCAFITTFARATIFVYMDTMTYMQEPRNIFTDYCFP